jgi:hypothetical protein
MRIDSSGNVGIGVTSPAAKLDVSNSNGRNARIGGLQISGTSSTANAGNNLLSSGSFWNGTNHTATSTTAATTQLGNGIVAFYTDSSLTAGNTFTATERMRIDSSGNVGIGTSVQIRSGLLSVNGVFSNNNTINWGPAGNGRIFSDSNWGCIFTADRASPAIAEFMWQNAGGTERMRIDSSGNLLVGTTVASSKLCVRSGSSSGTLSLAALAGGGGGSAIVMGNGDSGGTAGPVVIGSANRALNFGVGDSFSSASGGNVTNYMTIDSSGGLILAGSTAQKATGTTWSNPSDARLKNNIRDYTKGTDELMQVRVREWEYNGKGGTVEGTKGLGVVADEVMTILPDTVENYKAKLNTDDVESTDIKKFDATEITWLLVKTVQELKAELDSVKAELQTLKGA